MPRIDVGRLAACTAGVWAGVILGMALIGAPVLFDNLSRESAGNVAGRMFAREAYLSLAMAVVLLLLVRRQAKAEVEAGRGSVFSANVVLVLGALFCTLFGYFAIQPMMAAARAGQGMWSFGALHGLSAVMFGLKGVTALTLAWRLSKA